MIYGIDAIANEIDKETQHFFQACPEKKILVTD
jgi:hypothetical protein